MKKILFCLILMFSTIPAFSQHQYVEDYTGGDWITFSQREKSTYILGWMTAMSATSGLASYVAELNTSEEYQKYSAFIEEWTKYSDSLEKIVIIIDGVFSNPEARKYRLWDVILTLNNKEWW